MRLWTCLPLLAVAACYSPPGISSNPNGSTGGTTNGGGAGGTHGGNGAGSTSGGMGSGSTGWSGTSTVFQGNGGTTSGQVDDPSQRQFCTGGAANTHLSAPFVFGTGVGLVLDAAVADFNGDGRLDVAAIANEVGGVQLFLNQPQGLAAPTLVDLGMQPYHLLLADLQHSGRMDLIGVSSDTIGVARNLGGGRFRQPDLYGVGGTVVSALDINGDGFPDLLVANSLDRAVRVFLNLGDGTFDTQVVYPTHSNIDGMRVADLNGDGVPDLLVHDANDVRLLVNDGHGAFGAPTLVGVGQGDPLVDVFVRGADLFVLRQSSIALLHGDGHGAFAAGASTSLAKPAGEGLLADLDGDGVPDLVFSELVNENNAPAALPGSVNTLLGQAGGTFTSPASYPVCFAAKGLRAADFRHTGHLDVTWSYSGFADVGLLVNDGHAQFTSEEDAAVNQATIADVGDLDGDGRPDVVLINFNSEVSVMLGKP